MRSPKKKLNAAKSALAASLKALPPQKYAGCTGQPKLCHCKKSMCLKLYCECFAAGGICKDACKCRDCHNNDSTEEFKRDREKAMQRAVARNPNAFKPKVHPGGDDDEGDEASRAHRRGCRCKKSLCLKKYCECYQAGVPCGGNCCCINCHNRVRHICDRAAVSCARALVPHSFALLSRMLTLLLFSLSLLLLPLLLTAGRPKARRAEGEEGRRPRDKGGERGSDEAIGARRRRRAACEAAEAEQLC